MAGADDGPGGARREHVAGIQRARILEGALDVYARHGTTNLTVAAIVERAGVSRRTFYELYSSQEECLLATFEHAVACASAPVLAAYREPDGWREQLRAGLGALLAFLEAEPSCAQLLIVGSAGAGAAVQQRRSQLLADIASVLDGGRECSKRAEALSPVLAEGLAGGVLSVIQQRVLGGGARLTELLGPLMAMLVLPYLGADAAKAELRRRDVPSVAAQPRLGDPLAGLSMRLTYRTVRVLQAIAAQPAAASNKQIGAAAGVEDQGQISKLLARLQRLGLVVNESRRHQGMANAWRLTAQGSTLSRATSDWAGADPGAQASGERQHTV